MGCRLLNTNISSLSFKSSNSLFPSPNRTLISPNSLSKSLQGCNYCLVQRLPIIATSAHKSAPLRAVDVDNFLRECETYHLVEGKPLTCPLGWWEGHENEDISLIFEDFCKEYEKTYGSDEEKLRCFKVFKYTYEYIRQHNEFSDSNCTFSIAEHSDRPFIGFGKTDAHHAGYAALGIPVLTCNTIEAWNEQLAKGQRNNKLIVVEFIAEFCRQCGLMIPIIYEVGKKMPEVTILEVDMIGSELKTVAEKLGVDAIPAVVLMKNGAVVDKVVGPFRDEVLLKVGKHATSTAST